MKYLQTQKGKELFFTLSRKQKNMTGKIKLYDAFRQKLLIFFFL